MSMIEVKVPDIGDFKEVEVIEVLVKEGDLIAVDQSIVTVESDKASMEIPASHSGVVKKMQVKLGDKVKEGVVLLSLMLEDNPAGENAAPKHESALATQAVAAVETPQSLSSTSHHEVTQPMRSSVRQGNVLPAVSTDGVVVDMKHVHASPSVRRLAREFGVDLSRVAGTGPKARIMQEDVQHYVKGMLKAADEKTSYSSGQNGAGEAGVHVLPWPNIDFSQFGPIEISPLSRIKKLSGPNLHRNWVMIPHVTQFDEADITELEAFRQSAQVSYAKSGIKLTLLAFVMKACVYGLKKFPSFNASLDEKGEQLILKKYYHIGFAADTPNGLVVPVVKHVDQKSVSDLAMEMSALASVAREGKLKPTDMQGATFTLSSLGGVGGTAFTPIINAPEVAILGLSKSMMKPVWDGSQFQPRLMLPLSLSYDHRVIDGAMAARFTSYLSEMLADLRKTLL